MLANARPATVPATDSGSPSGQRRPIAASACSARSPRGRAPRRARQSTAPRRRSPPRDPRAYSDACDAAVRQAAQGWRRRRPDRPADRHRRRPARLVLPACSGRESAATLARSSLRFRAGRLSPERRRSSRGEPTRAELRANFALDAVIIVAMTPCASWPGRRRTAQRRCPTTSGPSDNMGHCVRQHRLLAHARPCSLPRRDVLRR